MRAILFAFLLLPGFGVWAQSRLQIGGVDNQQREAADYDFLRHSQLQPLVSQTYVKATDSTRFPTVFGPSNLEAKITPVLSLGGGYAGGSNRLLADVQAGLQVAGDINGRWNFGGTYAYHGGWYPGYLDGIADSLRIIPGVGKATSNGDYHQAHYLDAHLGFRINKYFYLEAGQGKHFWGDGYRSLILSHNAAPYPYLRFETKAWHLKYVNLWTYMRDFALPGDSVQMRGKFLAAHAISWNVSKYFNLGLFEMVTWQSRDLLSNRGMELNYLNPIIFYRPVEFAQGSADNVLLALTWRWKVNRKFTQYGQILIDEFLLREVRQNSGWWANKFGGQIGIKWFDVAKDLHFQTEVNVARPFTYTHGSVLQNYGQMHQSLAHPLGTNFLEWVSLIRFQRGKWNVRGEYIWAIYGRDRDGDNYGGNVYRSYKEPLRTHFNYLAQGLKSTFHYAALNLDYTVMPDYDGTLSFSYAMRFESNEFKRSNEHMFWVGIKMNPIRSYRDF